MSNTTNRVCIYVRYGDTLLREFSQALLLNGSIDKVDFLDRSTGYLKGDRFKRSPMGTAALFFTDQVRLAATMTYLRKNATSELSAYALPVLDAIIGSEP